jgi:outer membrane protein assembly factor BamB
MRILPFRLGGPQLSVDTVRQVHDEASSPRVSRRQLLLAGGTIAAAGAVTASSRVFGTAKGALVTRADAPRVPSYVTRPDLRIPPLTVTTHSRSVAPGLLLLAPYNAPNNAQAGAMIVDNSGAPLWEQPLPHLVTTDFRVQNYRGQPALTWWQGIVTLGHGVGGYVIADSSYAPIAHLNAGNGLHGDLHEFLLTDRGTALLTTYAVVTRDLRAVGGSEQGTIQDARFQEIDVATGRVLLEWHSLDHIPITESYWPLSANWDYVHLNSIGVDLDENLLVSSRNTHTIYKLDRKTGEVIWRLGGKHSNFAIDPPAQFAWQHDARRQPDGTITVFDNGQSVSRAAILTVDEKGRRVTLKRAYTHPSPRLHALSQGNVQVLPNGNVFVGWGAQPYVSEFSAGGELLFDAQLGTDYVSYRAYRAPWVGEGSGVPDAALRRAGTGLLAYASWNGDTRVARWVVNAGTTPANLQPIGAVARSGFETAMRIPRSLTHVRLSAVDAGGRTLGISRLLVA